MARIGRILTSLATAGFLLGATVAFAAGPYDARLRFRVLRTDHFTVYYHQGEAAMAARLAAIAETVRRDLSALTGLDAPRRTHVVLVDQSDVANGWSTPAPYNLIEIAATPPPPSSYLGHHDDWLRIVFAHEYAHILQLDRTGGAMRGLRWVLGRNPATFPNLFLPQWQVEGFATWSESALTGLGRVRAADVAAAVTAVEAGGRASIDRAGGGLVAWPSGNMPYFLGGAFDEAIAERYSPRALGDLSRETARRLPFLGGGAYGKVLGERAGALWENRFAKPAGRVPPSAGIRRLTREGFAVSGPRFLRPDAAAGGGEMSVYYSRQGPHGFPDIRRVAPGGGRATRVVTRADGQTLSSDGRWLYFDQLEFDGPSAIVSDLFARDFRTGHVRRLTRGARLTDPDVDASGSWLMAVRARDGEKRPAVWRIERTPGGAPTLAGEPHRVLGISGCSYASPRWSPDARRAVAVRQCVGSLPVIVDLGVADGAERVVAAGGRNITPTWSPDGGVVLFSSDREDRRFKLYAVDVTGTAERSGAPALVLDAPGGVMWPEVAPEGGTVVFTSLTEDGYDVFSAPMPRDALQLSGSQSGGGPGDSAPEAQVEAEQPGERATPAGSAYSPWKTLLPRAWSPLLAVNGEEVELGAGISSSDVLGYHEYSAAAAWRASGAQADIGFGATPMSWSLSYAYNRWRPSLLVSAWSTTDTVALAGGVAAAPLVAEERSHGLFSGVIVPWRRVRMTQSWLAGVAVDARQLPEAAAVSDRSRNGVRAGWALSTARQYGYSISPEDGIWMALNAERVTPRLGADANAATITADWRGYLRGLGGHHVLAFRLGAASSSGDPGMKRSFDLGGSGLQAAPFATGQRAIGLLRGLPRNEREGTAVLVANLDYRFPLARVERGVGNWPVFLRDVHGAVFADIGSAGRAIDALPAAASSIGGELAVRLTLGYSWNVSLAAGAAWVRDPSRRAQPDRVAAFVRTGYAF